MPDGCISVEIAATPHSGNSPQMLCSECRAAAESEYKELAEDTRHGNRMETETVSRTLALFGALTAALAFLLSRPPAATAGGMLPQPPMAEPSPFLAVLPFIGFLCTGLFGLNHYVFIKRTCDFEARLAYLDEKLGRVHYNVQPFNPEYKDVLERPRTFIWGAFYVGSATLWLAAVAIILLPGNNLVVGAGVLTLTLAAVIPTRIRLRAHYSDPAFEHKKRERRIGPQPPQAPQDMTAVNTRYAIQLLFFGAVVVGTAFWLAMDRTRPAHVKSPTPTEAQSGAEHRAAAWRDTLSSILEQERRLKRTARPGSFDDHFQIVLMHQLYLRNKRLSETGGKVGTPQPDAEFRQLTSQLKRLAKSKKERELARSLASGEAWKAQPGAAK